MIPRGYADPTASLAISHVMQERKRKEKEAKKNEPSAKAKSGEEESAADVSETK